MDMNKQQAQISPKSQISVLLYLLVDEEINTTEQNYSFTSISPAICLNKHTQKFDVLLVRLKFVL